MPVTTSCRIAISWDHMIPCIKQMYEDRKRAGLEGNKPSETCMARSVFWRACRLKFGMDGAISVPTVITLPGCCVTELELVEENQPGFCETIDCKKLSYELFYRLNNILTHPVMGDLEIAINTNHALDKEVCRRKFAELADLFSSQKQVADVATWGRRLCVLQDFSIFTAANISRITLSPLEERIDPNDRTFGSQINRREEWKVEAEAQRQVMIRSLK